MKPFIFILAIMLIFINGVAMSDRCIIVDDYFNEFLADWLNKTVLIDNYIYSNDVIAKTDDRKPLEVKAKLHEQVINVNRQLSSRDTQSYYRHKILKGDTLWGISRMYDIELRDLYSVNPNIKADNLIIGSYINVPVNGVIKNSFIWPILGNISSPFGIRKGEFHRGLDIAAVSGTEIKCTSAGIVIEAGWHNCYGKYVLVSHANNYSTRYAHCSEILVKKGDRVNYGDVISLVGSTGRSTGPHLHFEIIKNGKHKNPLEYLPKR